MTKFMPQSRFFLYHATYLVSDAGATGQLSSAIPNAQPSGNEDLLLMRVDDDFVVVRTVTDTSKTGRVKRAYPAGRASFTSYPGPGSPNLGIEEKRDVRDQILVY